VLYQGKISDLPLKYYGTLVVLGILLGVLGRFYQWTLLSFPKWYGKLPIPADWYGLVPFLLSYSDWICFFLDFLGGGNQIILTSRRNGYSIAFFLIMLLPFALLFLYDFLWSSGLPGGIFLPILTLGAITRCDLRNTFGSDHSDLDPIYVKNFVIVAMAGYFTAIGKAPANSDYSSHRNGRFHQSLDALRISQFSCLYRSRWLRGTSNLRIPS
jgi:H+/Cl- antiporter ClcA